MTEYATSGVRVVKPETSAPRQAADESRNEADKPDFLEIPQLDPAALRILALLQDDDFDLTTFANAASLDPYVANQLIRLASCPLYGPVQKFEDVTGAVVYLGLRTALSIGLGFSLFKGMRKGDGNFDQQWCWRRLLLNAVAAREVALRTRAASMDQAFLTGLVQDFGLLLLVQQRRVKYRELLAEFKREPQPLAGLEERFFGHQHAMVSEALLESWRFPRPIVRAVAWHHGCPATDETPPKLSAVLTTAESVTDFVLGPNRATLDFLRRRLATPPTRLDDPLAKVLEAIVQQVHGLSDVLQIWFPRNLDITAMLAEASKDDGNVT